MPDFILEMRRDEMRPGRTLNDLIVHLNPWLPAMEASVKDVGSNERGPWVRYSAKEALVFEYVVIDKTIGTTLAETFEIRRPTDEDQDDEPAFRSIEIYYNVSDIPNDQSPLDFRNDAMDLIERALEQAGAGEWGGAESGANLKTGEPEVNFGFEVECFETAEKIVRDTVKNTPYDCIREISRYDSTEYSG